MRLQMLNQMINMFFWPNLSLGCNSKDTNFNHIFVILCFVFFFFVFYCHFLDLSVLDKTFYLISIYFRKKFIDYGWLDFLAPDFVLELTYLIFNSRNQFGSYYMITLMWQGLKRLIILGNLCKIGVKIVTKTGLYCDNEGRQMNNFRW